MHVVFVLPRFFPYRGGYENSLLALAKYMVAHGHRVTVFTTVANDLEAFWLPEFRRFPEGQIEIDGVVINLPFYTPGAVTAAAEALRSLVGL